MKNEPPRLSRLPRALAAPGFDPTGLLIVASRHSMSSSNAIRVGVFLAPTRTLKEQAVGEHKLKRHRPEPKPFIGIYPLIVARPGIFRADPGQLAIIVDEPDYPLVAIQTPAARVADLLRAVDRVVVGRAHHRVATDFFSAFHDWCDNKRNPVPGV